MKKPEIANNDIIRHLSVLKHSKKSPRNSLLSSHSISSLRLCKKTNPLLSKSKTTPMTCKPRENTGLLGKFCNKRSELSQMLWCASHTLYYNGIQHAVAPRVYYRRTINIYNISTHYSTSKQTCIQVIQDCSRVNRIVFMHIFSYVAFQICRSQQYLTRKIRSFGGGCVQNTTPSCRDQFAAECKPELGEISTSISLMRTDFKFSNHK